MHDENTMTKVYDALRASLGLSDEKLVAAVSELQNRGILFRERGSADDQLNDALDGLRRLQREAWFTSESHGFHEDLQKIHDVVAGWANSERLAASSPQAVEMFDLLKGMFVSQKLKLITDEVAELHEHSRDGGNDLPIFLRCKKCGVDRDLLSDEYQEEIEDFGGRCGYQHDKDGSACGGELKPDGAQIEGADAFIRILDLFEIMGWDLAAATSVKMEYNKSRPYKHGRAF